jgi:hypothetical protein
MDYVVTLAVLKASVINKHRHAVMSLSLSRALNDVRWLYWLMIVELLENHRKLLLWSILIAQLIHQSLQSCVVLLLIGLLMLAFTWLYILIHKSCLGWLLVLNRSIWRLLSPWVVSPGIYWGNLYGSLLSSDLREAQVWLTKRHLLGFEI